MLDRTISGELAEDKNPAVSPTGSGCRKQRWEWPFGLSISRFSGSERRLHAWLRLLDEPAYFVGRGSRRSGRTEWHRPVRGIAEGSPQHLQQHVHDRRVGISRSRRCFLPVMVTGGSRWTTGRAAVRRCVGSQSIPARISSRRRPSQTFLRTCDLRQLSTRIPGASAEARGTRRTNASSIISGHGRGDRGALHGPPRCWRSGWQRNCRARIPRRARSRGEARGVAAGISRSEPTRHIRTERWP